jgi:hypothetical protein
MNNNRFDRTQRNYKQICIAEDFDDEEMIGEWDDFNSTPQELITTNTDNLSVRTKTIVMMLGYITGACFCAGIISLIAAFPLMWLFQIILFGLKVTYGQVFLACFVTTLGGMASHAQNK